MTRWADLAGVTGVGVGLRWDFLSQVQRHLRAHPDPAGRRIDFFEISPENYMRRGGYFPEKLDQVRRELPVLTHGLTMSLGGVDPLGDEYMAELRAFLDQVDAPYHSDHLCFSGTEGRIVHDLIPLPRSRAAAAHAAGRIREASDRLERPMAFENISYYYTPGAPTLSDEDFLVEVLERADCGLLLDVNNVFVNAQNHGFDPIAYLEKMPLERVVQLHIAGHDYRESEGIIIDTHGQNVLPSVFELLEWVIGRTGPRPVLLERDHNIPPFSELLEELDRVRASYDRGLAHFAESASTKPVALGSSR